MTDSPARDIVKVTLDERTVVRRSREVEHERAVAIYDLLEANQFRLTTAEPAEGPFHLHLAIAESRLQMQVSTLAGMAVTEIRLPMQGFRKIVRDYFMICESYYEAIRNATLAQIEAIDMGRRGIHDEGAELLMERLAAEVRVDHSTARRLFTLICVLHIRG